MPIEAGQVLGGTDEIYVEYLREWSFILSGPLAVDDLVTKEFSDMPIWLQAAGKWGSILVLIALLIAFLKQLIAFIGFITFAIKIAIVLAFVALIIFVGLMVLKGFKEKKRKD